MSTDKLDGTWIPIKQEIGGTVLPSSAFEKQKLIISYPENFETQGKHNLFLCIFHREATK